MIGLKNISKIFHSDNIKVKALDDISLDFTHNGLIMILGPSGSGKSTLLNILSLNEKANSGNYFLDEENTNRFSAYKISIIHRHLISMVYQYYHLLKEHTVFTNIYIPLAIQGVSFKQSKPIIEQYLKLFNLIHLRDHIVKTLSGGEAQRVAIIRALIINPNIILADEPTGAIDQKQTKEIMDIFKEIGLNRIVILVTHNKALAEAYGDRIITLKEGKIASDTVVNKTSLHINNDSRLILKKNHSWRSILIKHNIKKQLLRHFTSGLSLIIGLTMTIMTIGLSVGAPNAIADEMNKIGDRHVVSVSKKEVFYLADSPFATVTRTRPQAHEMHAFSRYFSSFEQHVSLAGIFDKLVLVTNNQKEFNGISFLPIRSKEQLSDIEIIDENAFNEITFPHIYINRQLANMIAYNQPLIINFHHSYQYQPYQNIFTQITDTYNFTHYFYVTAIINEVSIFNGPKIYYSYPAAKQHLHEVELDNLSNYMNTPISWYQRIIMGPEDHAISNYQRYLFLNSNDDLVKLKQIYNHMINTEGIGIEISSFYLQIDGLLKGLISGLVNILFIYIVIIFLGSLFIVGLISYTSFVEQKRDCALLINLGATKQDLHSIITKENVIASFITSVISIISAPILIMIANVIIKKQTNINSLISIPYGYQYNIPFLIPLLIIFFTLSFTYLTSGLPISAIKKLSISQQLKGE